MTTTPADHQPKAVMQQLNYWRCLSYTVKCFNKLRSCYNKCIKSFFGFSRRFSLTQVFLETDLPSFDTDIHNGAYTFAHTWQNCPNVLVEYFRACVF